MFWSHLFFVYTCFLKIKDRVKDKEGDKEKLPMAKD